MQQYQSAPYTLQKTMRDHVQISCVMVSKSSTLSKDPTKVGLEITKESYKIVIMAKNVSKAGKNVQQKCHIKLIFLVQRYLGRVGPQPSNLMKEEY